MSHVPTRRTLLAAGGALAGAAALNGPFAQTASATDRRTPKAKPTVVLVHGGYQIHSAGAWNPSAL
ncbi:hypothetical protein JK359_16355 [Streptomyces actinomycinicus]|uniref:Uncharacterized protein n=1 Tax=Streptomyces actinomycinicus TaxID=1695166 RepID=A0A937EI47_9ACTN|nr:hypothetical protein [Streptomyces actinomycinicus]MBL1083527.1 hypothetical protein [Streptomyces actinomycinicus]